ncbi:MAG: NAD(P)-dependent oxidoreductase [bacterium]|nr:NAD(P)-dependent oxidoreductase [bacterium]
MAARVLVSQPIPGRGLEALRREGIPFELNADDRVLPKAELVARLADKEGLLCLLTDRIDDEVLAGAPHLKGIANCAVGYDNIDVRALRDRRIAGAGLDVYEHEPALSAGLAELDNAVLLPHVGSATTETRARMAETAAANLAAMLRGERPPNLVTP